MAWRESLTSLPVGCLDLLFPPRCTLCNQELEHAAGRLLLCRDCGKQLARGFGPCCRRCGSSVPDPVSPDGGCRLCRGQRFHFERVFPVGVYVEDLRRAVLRAKHASQEPLCRSLAELLWRLRGDEMARFQPNLVVPIPMHWKRRMVRAINGPDQMAEVLARRLRKPAGIGWLRRTRDIPPQGSLPPGGRRVNVRGTMAVPWRRRVEGRRILVVDDVLTTGATCDEAARVLLRAGAAQVAAAVVARGEGVH